MKALGTERGGESLEYFSNFCPSPSGPFFPKSLKKDVFGLPCRPQMDGLWVIEVSLSC